jgi:hypothetical protein
MNWSLNTKNSQNFELDWGQVVKKVIKLNIFSGWLDTLIDCDNKLIRFLNSQLSLGIDDCLNSGLDEFLLK